MRLYLFIALIFSAAGAVTRALSLIREFDAETNLVLRQAPFSLVTACLSAALAVILFLLIPKDGGDPGTPRPVPVLWLVPELSAIYCLAGASAAYFVRYVSKDKAFFESGSLPVFIFALLSLLAAVSLLLTAVRALKGGLPPAYGLYLTIPVFWACFNLVLDYWNHAGNPVLSEYAYALLSYTALTLALYFASSCFYTGKGKRFLILFSLAGLYFSLLSLVPPLLAQLLLDGENVPRAALLPLPRLLLLSFTLLHSTALFWLSGKNCLQNCCVKECESADAPSEPGTEEQFPPGADGF